MPPVTTKEEADKLASSLASQLAHACLAAEGVCEGDTRVAPGAKLSVSGIGHPLRRDYVVSKVTHSFKGGGGPLLPVRARGARPVRCSTS